MLFSKIKGLPTLDAFGFKITRVMSERDKGENSPAHTSMVIVTERIANCDPMIVKTLTKADEIVKGHNETIDAIVADAENRLGL